MIFHNNFLGCSDVCKGVYTGRCSFSTWPYAGALSFSQSSVYPNCACQNESKVLQTGCLLRNSVRVMKDLCFSMVYLDDISFLLFPSLSDVLLLSILARKRYISSQDETSQDETSISVREDFYPSKASVQKKKKILKTKII